MRISSLTLGFQRLHGDTHVEGQHRVTWLLTAFHIAEASGLQISASQWSEKVFYLITRFHFPRLFSVFQCMFCSCVSSSFTEVPNWCISSLSKRGSFWFHNSSNLYMELGSWVDWDQNREQRFASNSSINLWTVCIDRNWSPYSTPWNILTSWEIRSMNSHVERKLGREYLCTCPWKCHPVKSPTPALLLKKCI